MPYTVQNKTFGKNLLKALKGKETVFNWNMEICIYKIETLLLLTPIYTPHILSFVEMYFC